MSSESREGTRQLRLALVLWGAVFLGIAVRVLVDRPGHRSVFAIYAEAAQRWRAGADLYPEEVRDTSFALFRYSPPVAALLTPFTFGPPALGEVAWRLLTGGLLLVSLVWWSRSALPHPLKASQVGVLLLLVLPLTVSNWNNGQSNPLVLALLLAAMAGVAESRWNLVAACVAVAALFKVYPIAAGLLLALLHPRRLLPRLAVALVLGATLPFLFQEPVYVLRQYDLWRGYLLHEDRTTWDLRFGNTDLQLLVRVWVGPLSTPAYRVIEVLAGLGSAAWCLAARRAGWSERRQLTLLFGSACVWMTAFGPATESATYMLLAPVAAWTVLEKRAATVRERVRALPHGRGPSRSSRLCLGLVSFAYLLLLSVQVSGWVPGLIRKYNKLGPQPLAALLLLAGVGGRAAIVRERSALISSVTAPGSAPRDRQSGPVSRHRKAAPAAPPA